MSIRQQLVVPIRLQIIDELLCGYCEQDDYSYITKSNFMQTPKMSLKIKWQFFAPQSRLCRVRKTTLVSLLFVVNLKNQL